MKGNLSDIKEVRKVDAYTVDVETHTPLPILPNELVQLLVMDKGWSEKNRATEASDLQKQQENFANRNANGTGPFQAQVARRGHEDGVRRQSRHGGTSRSTT